MPTGTWHFVVPDSVETEAIRWHAPELLESDMEDGSSIQRRTQATDVWAFGMTVVEVLYIILFARFVSSGLIQWHRSLLAECHSSISETMPRSSLLLWQVIDPSGRIA
jgi:hypothetical protein